MQHWYSSVHRLTGEDVEVGDEAAAELLDLGEGVDLAAMVDGKQILADPGIEPKRGRSSRRRPSRTGPRLMVVLWPRAYIVHVGDSRAFYLRKGLLRQLTRDQTTGEYMVDAGAWTEEQARQAPMAGALVSALGADELTPAVGLVDLQPGDVLLLCTDGLTRVDAALAGGGSDNVTVVVARMQA